MSIKPSIDLSVGDTIKVKPADKSLLAEVLEINCDESVRIKFQATGHVRTVLPDKIIDIISSASAKPYRSPLTVHKLTQAQLDASTLAISKALTHQQAQINTLLSKLGMARACLKHVRDAIDYSEVSCLTLDIDEVLKQIGE